MVCDPCRSIKAGRHRTAPARTVEAVKRLVALYEAWGKPDKAAEFRALLPESGSGES